MSLHFLKLIIFRFLSGLGRVCGRILPVRIFILNLVASDRLPFAVTTTAPPLSNIN